LEENAYEESYIVVSGSPSNIRELAGPVTVGTLINLPPDSRDSNNNQNYIVGKGDLELYLDGELLNQGEEWEEVGSVGSEGTQIEILIQLEVDDTLTLRIDVAGGFVNLVEEAKTELQAMRAILAGPTYEEPMVVVDHSTTDPREITSPVPAGAIIDIPPNSRNSDLAQSYTVGNGNLEVYLDGELLDLGSEWNEVGSAGSISTQIEILIDLVDDDQLTFRIDTTGGYVDITTLAGVSLQSAYGEGRTITVSSGFPVVIQGPASEKLISIQGDMEVTGVIDPKGVQFTRQLSNPLATNQDGIWFNTAGEMIHSRFGHSDINITASVGSELSYSDKNVDIFENNSLFQIDKGKLVSIDASGDLIESNVTDEAVVDGIVGVTKFDIPNGDPGEVVTAGRLEDITTGVAVGSLIFLDKFGNFTATKPEVGVAGFVAGDWVIKIGIIVKNKSDALKKDLLIRIGDPIQL